MRSCFPYPLLVGIAPVDRVVNVGEKALAVGSGARAGDGHDGFAISWEPGPNSMCDTPTISSGNDIGGVIVQRQGDEGSEDLAYDPSFAFGAFLPDGSLHLD